MSTNLALAHPLRRPETEERAPHLEIAPDRAQRRARPKVVYAIVVVGGIGVILLAQLLMSIALADGAYRINGLQQQERDYSRQQRALSERLDVLGSTQNLTGKAEGLGMVRSGNPVFLDVASGAVTGTGSQAGGSLTDGGNLVGNSLLADDSIDQEALSQARQQAAQQTPQTEEDGGIATDADGTGSATPSTGATGGTTTTTGATPGGGAATGAPSTSGGAGSVPSTPGRLASPTTH